MRIDFSTICTSDYFQYYIPIYAYCLRKLFPDNNYRISIGVTGPINDHTRKLCEMLPDCRIRDLRAIKPDEYFPTSGIVVTYNVVPDLKLHESTANTMRWLYFLETPNDYYDLNHVDAVMILDIDLLLFDDNLIDWHRGKATEIGAPYYAHHGPWKKPRRFPEGWTGLRERLAGGFVWLEKGWFDRTKMIRAGYMEQLERGKIGLYREEDETILCRICREAGLPITDDKYFPPTLRGIHLGDFKASMEHRYTDTTKMAQKLTDANCMRYAEMLQCDETFAALVDKVRAKEPIIDGVFENLHTYLEKRGVPVV